MNNETQQESIPETTASLTALRGGSHGDAGSLADEVASVQYAHFYPMTSKGPLGTKEEGASSAKL